MNSSDVGLADLNAPSQNPTSEAIHVDRNLESTKQELGNRPDAVIPNESAIQNNPAPIITLGQLQETPFVVAIPGSREDRLDRVQETIPQAFLTDSRRGRYIQAGAFSTRSDAEVLSRQLRYRGFDARVVYFRVRS